MQLLNGKVIADKVKDDLQDIVTKMKGEGKTFNLCVIQVGDDPASSVYVRNKERACEYIGIESEVIKLTETVNQDDVISIIHGLNNDDSVNGILVQLPLPNHLDEQFILSNIDPMKDVDGFHPNNVGNLFLGNDTIVSCTPQGIMGILYYYGIDIAGKECVVVGRSNIVGKPMAMLLLEANGTVTVCHSKTENLKEVCKRADILVCAIGKPKFFNEDYVKNGAVVIDVGIHRMDNGKLCGDVDFDAVKDIVSAITPVPNGVGAMTVAMLMDNLVQAAMKQQGEWW